MSAPKDGHRKLASICPFSAKNRTRVRVPHSSLAGRPNQRAPEDGILFLHYLDVLPPDGGGRFTQYECLLCQLQVVCCKGHQIFGHARLSTLLCEPYVPFG